MSNDYEEYSRMLAQNVEKRAERFHRITQRENDRLSSPQLSSAEIHTDSHGDTFIVSDEFGGERVYLEDEVWSGEYDTDDFGGERC